MVPRVIKQMFFDVSIAYNLDGSITDLLSEYLVRLCEIEVSSEGKLHTSSRMSVGEYTTALSNHQQWLVTQTREDG